MSTIYVPQTTNAETGPQTGSSTTALTVLFAELSNPTLVVGPRADTYIRQAMERHEEIAKNIIEGRDGRVVKTMDGSVLADFPGPAFAVRAAIEMERAWQLSNQALPLEQQLDLRIGIHACSGERLGLDLFGDGVSIAAAMTRLAAPGQVLISKMVHDTISSESDLHSKWLSQVALPGRTERQDVYEAHWADAPTNIPARYEVMTQLGSGGMGVVYKVRDAETGEIIALKVLKSGIASDPAMQENLRREVCLARKVTHKNVCRIHEFNRSNGAASISMEFVEGESLSVRLHRSGALPWTEALQIVRQICAGLREAHAQGIVHRDLKPANIMVDPNGIVKIMDFGIARMSQSDSQLTGTMVGTPAYMAPEQVELKAVSARTDIYALGLLLYEMVTAVPAFSGETPIAIALKQVREFPQRPREIVPSLPAYAEGVILKCLHKDPTGRFATVDQLQMALAQKQRAKAAPAWGMPQVKGAAKKAEVFLRAAQGEVIAFLKDQDWSMLRTKRAQQVAVITVGAAALLTAGFFLVRADSHKVVTDNAPVTAPPPASQWPEMQSASPAAPANRIVGQESVSIFAPAPAARNIPAAESRKNDPAAHVMSVVEVGPSKSSSSPVARDLQKKNGHTQPTKATQPAASKNLNATATHAPTAAAMPTTPAVSATTDNSSNNQKMEDLHPTPAPVAAVVPESHSADATPTEENSSGPHSAAPQIFLEVGSFKEATWADDAVEKLNGLGFHAVSIHKTKLWVQSYHVQVGPYASSKEAEAAQQSLEQQGMKPHIIK